MASEPPSKGFRPLQIGRYQIQERIATGGMGAVYRAKDIKRHRAVALKVLSADQAQSRPLMLERFKQEARYGRRLNHENVVSFYRFGKNHGIYYLAMEFVDGTNLEDYIKERTKLTVPQSVEFMIQATKAIDHLHKHGIIHRDIKPSNFIVTKKNDVERIKLIDLGLARRTPENDSRVTQPGTTLGTVDYISPEQVRDSTAVDIRSDIYSLGCTWYHMLAGHAPFAEGTVTERIYKHMEVDPPHIRDINPDVPPETWKVLKKMLAKDPVRRYQSPTDLLKDLEARNKMSSASQVLDRFGGATPSEPALALGPVRRLSHGRRQFIDLEDEEGVGTSQLFNRPRRKKPLPVGKIVLAISVVGVIAIAVIVTLFTLQTRSGTGRPLPSSRQSAPPSQDQAPQP
jgi:serine/threonine-protein kinase